MSKLAAICAKLETDAKLKTEQVASKEPVSDNNSNAIFSSRDADLFTRDLNQSDSSYSDEDPIGEAPFAFQLGLVANTTNRANKADELNRSLNNGSSTHESNLKRPALSPNSGASRRKKFKPLSSKLPETDNESEISDTRDLEIDMSPSTGRHSTSPVSTISKDWSNRDLSTSPQPMRNPTAVNQPITGGAIEGQPGALNVINGLLGLYNLQLAAAMANPSVNSKSSKKKPSTVTSSQSPVPAASSSQSKSSTSTANGFNSGFPEFMKRFGALDDCGVSQCAGAAFKDHFHCTRCAPRMIFKKEEILRHCKWHRKREESLQFGFSRFTQWEGCEEEFPGCEMSQRQTHYHCIQPGCGKVYVSTSDVQMHNNYHRKASAIIMEGFQRFRATDNCLTESCAFHNQRTTHFHCRRPGCTYTFKNKADMEKHKSYHQKDDMLAKDGFKKYMKYEKCGYRGCAFSNISNHIHCTRAGCSHVLHSTSQVYSHKRKHTHRHSRSMSLAHRNQETAPSQPPVTPELFKPTPSTAPSPLTTEITHSDGANVLKAADLLSTVARLSQVESQARSAAPPTLKLRNASHTAPNPASTASSNASHSPSTDQQTRIDMVESDSVPDKSQTNLTPPPLLDSRINPRSKNEDVDLTSSLNLVPGSLSVITPCSNMLQKSGEVRKRSSRITDKQREMMSHFQIMFNTPKDDTKKTKSGTDIWKDYLTRYTANDPCNSRCEFLYKDHYHCNVANCYSAFKSKDRVRDHARHHEQQEKITGLLFHTTLEGQDCHREGCGDKTAHYHCKWPECDMLIDNSDIFGRIKHYHQHEHSTRLTQSKKLNPRQLTTDATPCVNKGEVSYQSQTPVSAEATSFKCDPNRQLRFAEFGPDKACLDKHCIFKSKVHYHCTRERCFHVSDRLDVSTLHSQNFHEFINIPKDYLYFDRNINCRRFGCQASEPSSHYHCNRPGCDYSFKRITTIQQHDSKHAVAVMRKNLHKPVGIAHTSGGVPSAISANRLTLMQSVVNGNYLSPKSSNEKGASDVATNGNVPTSSASPNRLASSTSLPERANHQLELLAALSRQLNAQKKPTDTEPTESWNTQDVNMSDVKLDDSLTLISDSLDGGTSSNFLSGEGGATNFLSQLQSLSQLAATVNNPNQEKPVVDMNVSGATAPRAESKVVKSSGTFFPKAAATTGSSDAISLNSQPSTSHSPVEPSRGQGSRLGLLNELSQKLLSFQKTRQDPATGWQQLLARMYYTPTKTCNSVFCKKKKTDHFHCLQCGQFYNMDAEEKLRRHFVRHASVQVLQTNDSTKSSVSLPAVPRQVINQSVTANQAKPASDSIKQALSSLSSPTSASLLDQLVKAYINKQAAASKIDRIVQDNSNVSASEVVSADSSTSDKPNKTNTSNRNTAADVKDQDARTNLENGEDSRSTDDQSVIFDQVLDGTASSSCTGPEPGNSHYVSYTKNEDCAISNCANKGSEHYHCKRESCKYGFTDMAKFPQHVQRHEKLDKLMGEHFKLFRPNVDCGRADCEHSQKSSHFHCLLCPYICMEPMRIMPHRRHHQQTDKSAS